MGNPHAPKTFTATAYSVPRNHIPVLRSILIAVAIFISLFYTIINHPNYFEQIPLLRSVHLPSKHQYAYATLLHAPASTYDLEDPAVIATRVLMYQILHRSDTKTQNVPFLVLVTPDVPVSLQYILSAEGATVIKVDNTETGPERHQDDSILRLFELTQYNRILYLSRNTLLTKSLDSIWAEIADYGAMPTQRLQSAQRQMEENMPAKYFVAGIPNDTNSPNLDSDFLVLEPSASLSKYYKALISTGKHQDDGVLAFAHRQYGEMPFTNLTAQWSSNKPSASDLEQNTAALHGQFWLRDVADSLDRAVVEQWWRVQGQMEGFWQAKGHLQRL